ncbi:MAG: outer membrane beta-barrel protein [Prolixibacteraceae bacterium]
MKILLAIIFTGLAWNAFAQSHSLSGEIFSKIGSPLASGSVVLLSPADSTMQSFGITNKQGHFDIKNIKKGDYILQISFLGFETLYKKITIPVPDNNLGAIVMNSKPVDIQEVTVVREYVPISLRHDTVEFNAAAFKLKPDAVTEDLLKKLPGVEVDRAGNIKAMGEDVKKLYVDGKEFFGNDPKVATKNVPADAIDKVQFYDRKSEEALFTGIDDGSRQKVVNLKLREDKKNGVFGNLMAGGGTGEHWQGNAKAYRFSDKMQLAALGMANNVNQSGFSFGDYLNFGGGMGNMSNGGGSSQIRISSDGSFPINFGEPVAGLNSSGAGGANFSYSKSPNNRIFVSYLGKESTKQLEQTTKSWNYTSDKSFFQDESLSETDRNTGHTFNFGLRSRIDSTKNIVVDGNISLTNGHNNRLSKNTSTENSELVNYLDNLTSNHSNRISGNTDGSYIKKLKNGKSIFKVSGNLSISHEAAKNLIDTQTGLYNNHILTETGVNKFQNNASDFLNWSAGTSLLQKLGNRIYIEPEIVFGSDVESLSRSQGFPELNNFVVDSLSPEFQKKYMWFRPKVSLIRNTTKAKLTIGLEMEDGNMSNTLNNNSIGSRNYLNFLPFASWDYEYQPGRRLAAGFSSSVNAPSVTQLLPVGNNLNPLAVYYGNPNLKPETQQRINLHWFVFDQFSFTSFVATLSGTTTKNKINWDRTINQNLSFVNTLTNVKNDAKINGNFDFSSPIRKLGIKVHVNFDEGWNKGLNLINKQENENTNFTHRGSLSFDNRKKDKWDVSTGIEVSLTNSRYSLQKSLNNNYLNMSWFGVARFNPNDKWNFEVNGDIAKYTDQSFGESLTIPVVNFEISRFILKNKRGTLTLRGFDLLDRNSIIQRFSELNYLREVRSNSIGRFVLLSFTYRLNKFGGESKGVVINMRR